MNKKDLLNRCQELGIDVSKLPTESKNKVHTNAELKEAIKAKEDQLLVEGLEEKARSLGMDPGDFDDIASLEAAIADKEEQGRIKELQEQADILEIDTEGLNTVKDYQEAIEAKKAEIVAARKNVKTSYKDPEGVVWEFSSRALQTINIDGVPMTQEEIMADESIIAWLVTGKNSFITRKR